MQRLRPVAVGAQVLDELVHLQPRAAEHDRRRGVLDLQHAGEGERLVRAVDEVGDLADAREPAGDRLLAGDRHSRRVLEVAAGDRGDARRECRREEGRLLPGRRLLEDGLEVLREAHVQHLVGLVQREERHAVELERAALQVVERTAGRRHDDVGAVAERAHLRRHRRAAVHRHHREPQSPRVLVHRLRDLHRQLAGGDEHETAGAPARAGGVETLQHRQRERRRLAGAGGGLPEHVAALEQERDGLALDRRRFLVAERGDRGDERGGEAEAGEVAVGGRRCPCVVGSPGGHTGC